MEGESETSEKQQTMTMWNEQYYKWGIIIVVIIVLGFAGNEVCKKYTEMCQLREVKQLFGLK
jgi:hypothetical protein